MTDSTQLFVNLAITYTGMAPRFSVKDENIRIYSCPPSFTTLLIDNGFSVGVTVDCNSGNSYMSVSKFSK